MSRYDTVSERWIAEFEFLDSYAVFPGPTAPSRIACESPPRFTSEEEAVAAEDLAHTVFMDTLQAFRWGQNDSEAIESTLASAGTLDSQGTPSAD